MSSCCRFPLFQLVRGLSVVALVAMLIPAAAQTRVVKPITKSNIVPQHQRIDDPVERTPVANAPRQGTMGSATATDPAPQHMRGTTMDQRRQAAAHAAQDRLL